jgi:hypothetical protein
LDGAHALYAAALITRGAGAYTYTYYGPEGLVPGQLTAVTFSGKLELGVVVGPEANAPPSVELLPLWPVEVAGYPGWGKLLLSLCELSAAAPDELAGHMLFDAPGAGLKLSLALPQPERLEPTLRDALGPLCGALTPGKRVLLARGGLWPHAAAAGRAGLAELGVHISGAGPQARGHPHWRKWFAVDKHTLRLWGLAEPLPAALPGSYLAGLAGAAGAPQWPAVQPPAGVDTAPPCETYAAPELQWEPLAWAEDWDICRRWPEIGQVSLRRASATWATLRGAGGLAAELALATGSGENVLVIAPQSWLLDRLWPALAPWAARVARFLPESGPGAAGHILRRLGTRRGQAVAGGPGAWKLAVYGRFDRVLLLDPSHPQYASERAPGLDPRLGLILALAHQSSARLDMLDVGLSAWDGRGTLRHVALLDAYEPAEGGPPVRGRVDTNPLPLELRQPGVRRLVYFNRLGSGRGLRCVECARAVVCPQCGSARVHYSAAQAGYLCPQCGYSARELRCPECGLATLAAQVPGLEAVALRKGDFVVHGMGGERRAHPESQTVLGTAQLLEPLTGFWPQEVVYVHADARVAQFDDWPQALDMAARLAALYSNPELRYTYIVSARLRAQLGAALSAEQLATQWGLELKLRRLAGLPPYGCLYRLRLRAGTLKAAAAGRLELGRVLQAHPGTRLLRLGRPYEEQGAARLAGHLINPALSARELQELRWEVYRAGARLSITPLCGPW